MFRMFSFLLKGFIAVGLICSFSLPIAHAETIRMATIGFCPLTCDPEKENGKEGFMTDVVRYGLEGAGFELMDCPAIFLPHTCMAR